LHFHSLNENSNHLNQIAGHVKLFIKEAEGNPMKEIKSHKWLNFSKIPWSPISNFILSNRVVESILKLFSNYGFGHL